MVYYLRVGVLHMANASSIQERLGCAAAVFITKELAQFQFGVGLTRATLTVRLNS